MLVTMGPAMMGTKVQPCAIVQRVAVPMRVMHRYSTEVTVALKNAAGASATLSPAAATTAGIAASATLSPAAATTAGIAGATFSLEEATTVWNGDGVVESSL